MEITCLIVVENNLKYELEAYINSSYILEFISCFEEAYTYIQRNSVHCIVFCLDSTNNFIRNITILQNNFPNIPIIAITNKPNVELIRYCGEVGVCKVIEKRNLKNINNILKEQIAKKSIIITLRDFNIHIKKYPTRIRKGLKIIESNYLELMGIQEIADQLFIKEAILSRDFKKHNLTSPKKLLMYFKVKHSLNLMENSGFRLREIAYLTGFSNEQRFNECFYRTFKKSPGCCRNEILITSSLLFWNSNVIIN